MIARLTDDGVGAISLDAGPGHLGMATMRARADAEGARLDITCTPGAGTTVVLTLPTADRRHVVNDESAPGTDTSWSSHDQSSVDRSPSTPVISASARWSSATTNRNCATRSG